MEHPHLDIPAFSNLGMFVKPNMFVTPNLIVAPNKIKKETTRRASKERISRGQSERWYERVKILKTT